MLAPNISVGIIGYGFLAGDKMKIGIVITGISYGCGRDFRHCYNNIYAKLIEPYMQEHEVNVYLTSYHNEKEEELVNTYKPAKHQFLSMDCSHQVLTYISGLDLVEDEDLDFVICTRPDIHFHKNMKDIDIDYQKFNALFHERGWWDSMHFTTDNYYAFPHDMLSRFKLVLYDLYQNPSRAEPVIDLHQAFFRMQKIIGISKTKIVSDLDELSNYNSFYSLCNLKWGVCNKD